MRVSELEDHNGGKGIFATVSPSEAVRLIQSLSNQLVAGNANSGRMETYLEDGRDFSIGVEFPIATASKG